VFAHLPDNAPAETIPDLYRELYTRNPGSVQAFTSDAEYFDIGTPGDYLDTSLTFAAREGSPLVGARAQIAADARIDRSVLWDDVRIGPGAFLQDCIVTDGAHVPADTSWRGVTLRRATGDLTAGEKRIGELAIGTL
jgi:NDP-sugar pyrophosphorylase family protein